jgi:Mrp family chromosome partitioning ATPase
MSNLSQVGGHPVRLDGPRHGPGQISSQTGQELRQRRVSRAFSQPVRAGAQDRASSPVLLEILRDGCDLVILDCGLALNGPETALLARHADATLVVSPRSRLRGRSLAHATQMLEKAKAAPVGLVLAS